MRIIPVQQVERCERLKNVPQALTLAALHEAGTQGTHSTCCCTTAIEGTLIGPGRDVDEAQRCRPQMNRRDCVRARQPTRRKNGCYPSVRWSSRRSLPRERTG